MLWSSKPIPTARPGESEAQSLRLYLLYTHNHQKEVGVLGFRIYKAGILTWQKYGELDDTSPVLGFGVLPPGLLLIASPSLRAFSFTHLFVAAPERVFVNHEGEVEEKTYEAPEKEAPKDEAKIQVGFGKKGLIAALEGGSTMHVGAN